MIGFVHSNFWYNFAFPLLQVGQRVFTCATTPPPSQSFFSVFMTGVKDRNAVGDYFFRLVDHSLVCVRCYERGIATECRHRLGLIPPWKPLMKITRMKELVPAKRMNDYEAEVYGVIHPDGSKYFPERLVNANIIKRDVIEHCVLGDQPTIYICVDPASHFRSTMGLSAIAYGLEGQIVVMGISAVRVERCQTMEGE